MQAGSGSDPRWWALARRETASTRHGETRGAAAERQAGVPCAAGDRGAGAEARRGAKAGAVFPAMRRARVWLGDARRGTGSPRRGRRRARHPRCRGRRRGDRVPGAAAGAACGARLGPELARDPWGCPVGGRQQRGRGAGAHPSAGHSGPGAVREAGGAVFRGHGGAGHPGHPGPGAGGGEREAARRGERGQDQGAQEKGDPDEGWCVRPAHPQRP